MAVVALLSGNSLLIATVAGLIGSEAVVNMVSLTTIIFMLVWLVWLGIVFLSRKF
jgi:ATP/ADP translocase